MTHDEMQDDGPVDLELDETLLAEMRLAYNPPPKPRLDAMWVRVAHSQPGMRGVLAAGSDSSLAIVPSDERPAPERRVANQRSRSEAHR
jgi:hypothetical protein